MAGQKSRKVMDKQSMEAAGKKMMGDKPMDPRPLGKKGKK